MSRAQYERMEDGEWYAYIPEFKGLWTTGATKEAAEKNLY
jgi:predicted RNase H-like HicB family nuclease